MVATFALFGFERMKMCLWDYPWEELGVGRIPWKKNFQFFSFMQWLMVGSLKSLKVLKWDNLSVALLKNWQWVTQNRQNVLIGTNNFMQNCPLQTTQITSVITLNAWNFKIYTPTDPAKGGSQYTPGPPVARAFILQICAFVTKLKLYLKTATAKSTWIKAWLLKALEGQNLNKYYVWLQRSPILYLPVYFKNNMMV